MDRAGPVDIGGAFGEGAGPRTREEPRDKGEVLEQRQGLALGIGAGPMDLAELRNKGGALDQGWNLGQGRNLGTGWAGPFLALRAR